MAECDGNCASCTEQGACEDSDKKLQFVLGRIKRKVMVLSGKGGVGKSSIAAALAFLLAQAGKKAGLLDLDFHGPSQPTLFGVPHLRVEAGEAGLLPLEAAGGVKLISIGLMLDDPDQAVIWRGPAKIAILRQLLEDVDWGELDYLICDFPPGTGDEALSAAQMVTGDRTALIVATPQELALADCRKCVDFCRKLKLNIAGIVENLAAFTCPNCGKTHRLFSTGGGEILSKAYGIPLLAQLPIHPKFMELCDAGDLNAALLAAPEIRTGIENVMNAIQ